MQIAAYIDHTALQPVTTSEAVKQLCEEAITAHFAAVCVPPYYVAEAKGLLQGTTIKTATVVGFPMGYSTMLAKLQEIDDAIADGADEIDMVHNIAALKNGDWQYLENEVKAATRKVHASGRHIKVIIESGLLTDEEIIKCCKLYAPLHIDLMKTCTGFAATGATVHAVALMRAHLPAAIGIKASGGIRSYAFAKELVDAGATRLGCSDSMAIVKEHKEV